MKVKCSNCGTALPLGHEGACPNCGKNPAPRTLSVVVNEVVRIKDHVIAIVSKSREYLQDYFDRNEWARKIAPWVGLALIVISAVSALFGLLWGIVGTVASGIVGIVENQYLPDLKPFMERIFRRHRRRDTL